MQYKTQNTSTEIYKRYGSYQTVLKYENICTSSIMKASNISPSRQRDEDFFFSLFQAAVSG